jgi:hypothetical protein
MPEPLDLDDEQELTTAGARAMELHTQIAAGAMPPQADLLWLCRAFYAVLLRLETIPTDTRERPDWLAALPDPQQES